MSGSWINQKQRALYMSSRSEGDKQECAAARSGFSERSGRRIEKGTGGPNHRKPRRHRTRKDPLSEVWDTELVPMLEKQPALKAITLMEHIQHKYPNQYPDSIRRTLERRVKMWRAESGPEKEVIFRQTHQPGLMGISDFTEPKKSFHITIRGKPLSHILFHFRLPFSGWSYVRVIESGESFIALTTSLNDAFKRLGGTPKTHRTDSLSAAYKNMNKDEKEDTTKRYQEFCDHYSMKPTRNNRGVSHENGAIESPHGHLKRRIGQELLLRGTNDFGSVEEYNGWIGDIVSKQNRRQQDKINEERATLTPLPATMGVDYEEIVARVASTSTIQAKRVTYSVPSRLIGELLRVRLYERHLELFIGNHKTLELDRSFASDHTHRARSIDFRHVIGSLLKKPQSFRHSVLRDDLLPNDQYRAIWKQVDAEMNAHFACKFMVNILYIAAKGHCVQKLGDWLLEQDKLPQLHQVRQRFFPAPPCEQQVTGNQHNITDYDALIKGSQT
jgi:transposase InsO family protein